MRLWETPVPIPNTTVKTQTADGTMLETAWESRWMPELVFTSDQRVQGLNSLMADKISVSHVPGKLHIEYLIFKENIKTSEVLRRKT